MSSLARASRKSSTSLVWGEPVTSSISLFVIFFPFPNEITFCKVPSASRNAPSAKSAMSSAPPSSNSYPSNFATFVMTLDKIASVGFF